MNNGDDNMCKTSVLKDEIKVLVIDHKQEFLAAVTDFLKYHTFEVTCAHQAGAALRILTENNDKYDLLLIASDMSDVDTITFLRLVRNMDMLSIVMSDKIYEADDTFLLEVIENGGFRVVKTPLTSDVVTHIRQDAIRARLRKFEQQKTYAETPRGRKQKGTAKRKRGRKRKVATSEVTDPDPESLDCSRVKRRFCINWTPELHERFIRVVLELGEDKCYPKAILDAMAVPGLTRLQVASHLQKSRPEIRKLFQKKRRLAALAALSNDLLDVETHVENHDDQHQLVTNIDDGGQQSDVNNQSFIDFSAINGFDLENFEDVYSGPADSSDHSNFPPNELSDDFFDILDINKDANPALACMELDVPGPSCNHTPEEVLPGYDQLMAGHQETEEFNNQIEQQGG